MSNPVDHCKPDQRGIAADNREFEESHKNTGTPNPVRQKANKVVHCPHRNKGPCENWDDYQGALNKPK
ncbi:TPA: hypothetical protein ACH3X2_007421 [Trebouxia sp. C0005]